MTTATQAISPEVLRQHGLTPDEYEKIRQLLGDREPTLTELGIFSVMWSEHCSYKSSRVHLKRLPTRSKRVAQGPLQSWIPYALGQSVPTRTAVRKIFTAIIPFLKAWSVA